MCDVHYDGDESASAWRETPVKRARRRHRCRTCDTQIDLGDAYHKVSYVFDRRGEEEKCCLACHAIAKAFGDAHHVLVAPSMLLEELDNCVIEDGSDQWRAASNEIRERLKKSGCARAADSSTSMDGDNQ